MAVPAGRYHSAGPADTRQLISRRNPNDPGHWELERTCATVELRWHATWTKDTLTLKAPYDSGGSGHGHERGGRTTTRSNPGGRGRRRRPSRSRAALGVPRVCRDRRRRWGDRSRAPALVARQHRAHPARPDVTRRGRGT